MSQQKRYSLTIRLQPTAGTLLAEMTKWLNQMPVEEKNEKVTQALLMTYFPLVRADAGAELDELEKCYWEFEQWFYHHRFILRQRLKLSEKFHWKNDSSLEATAPLVKIPKEEKEEEVGVPSPPVKLYGEKGRKDLNSLFSGIG